MRKIVQNIDLVALTINSDGSFIFLPKDRIFFDKKIKNITVIGATDTPYSPDGSSTIASSVLSYTFLKLFNKSDKLIFRSVLAKMLSIDNNTEIHINDYLNFQLSEIFLTNNSAFVPGSYSLLLAVEYQTRLYSPFIEPDNCYTVEIPNVGGKTVYNLKDYGINFLTKKTITRITATGDTTGFITIRDKSDKVINEMPLCLLKENLTSENTYFDRLNIDFQNSYISVPNGMSSDLSLTFYY